MAICKKMSLSIIVSVMLLTSLTAGFIAVNVVNAQAVSLPAPWNEVFGGSVSYAVSSLVNTSDGGYAMAGSVNGTSAFLIKADTDGTVQWSKTYAGLGYVQVAAMLQTNDGGYLIAGGTALNSIINSSDCFFWLVKTNSVGNQEWNKTYEQSTTSGVYSVIQTSDSGYVLVGSATNGNQTNPQALMVKTDTSGTMKWNQTYNGSDWSYATSVVQANDRGYALAGSTNLNGQMAQDYWLVKTDANGGIEWDKTYVPQARSGGAGKPSIAIGENGSYTLAGYNGVIGGTRIWVINVDSNGNQVWASAWPQIASQPLTPTGFIQTNDGGCVVTGSADALNGFNGLQSYLFIFKLASDGNLQWQKTYSTLTDKNSALQAVQTNDGNYVLAGTMLSNATGLEMVWFAKVDSVGSTVIQRSTEELTLQPATIATTVNQPAESLSIATQDWYVWVIVVGIVVGILAGVIAVKKQRK